MCNNKSNSKSNTLPSLRLSTSTSLQALADKALRAAAIAEAARKASAAPAPKAPDKKRRKAARPAVATQLDSFMALLQKSLGDQYELKRENPGDMSLALADIKVYGKEELARAADAFKAWKAMGAPRDCKPRAAAPERRFVVFASVHNARRLGSVAVYCRDPHETALIIRRHGHLFGLPIRSVSVETGLSVFVDVTLKG